MSLSLSEWRVSGPSLLGDVGAVVTKPELRRLEESKVWENGESVDVRLGVASLEKDGVLWLSLDFGATAFLAPLDRKKLNGASDEELDADVAAESRPERMLVFSLSSLARSFLARCSPTSSLSGSVHITSHMFLDSCRCFRREKTVVKGIDCFR